MTHDSDDRRQDPAADWDEDVQNPPLPDGGPRDGVHEDDDELVGLGAQISPDTHVGSGSTTEQPSAEPSEANPSALVDGNEVGDGTELEQKDGDDR